LPFRRQIISTPISDTPAQLYVLTGFLYYGDNITDMVFLVKNIFNQKINTLYDSRVGKYVGFGEYGMTNAAHYNSQKWKMDERKVEVETLCRYNARLFRRSTLDRKGKVLISRGEFKRSMLECSVMGFFPQEVRLSWLRDGVEVTTDVSSTDVLANGDWSFQLHSYLEFTPRRGERVSCRVEHSSLRESLELSLVCCSCFHITGPPHPPAHLLLIPSLYLMPVLPIVPPVAITLQLLYLFGCLPVFPPTCSLFGFICLC
uniref:Ig-like domain-containing protein n=1 Tax=Sander lucioperca TaxID=283035 RepID=A0A8D0CYD8_SANLU